MFKFILLLCTYATFALSATSADWRSRSIYQVFVDRFATKTGSTTQACDVSKRVYCGGTWLGLINKLDYIKNMGFTAVWISPITHNTEAPSAGYHGYWQDDIYSLNQHFGSTSDLKALSTALHQRGMYLMVDVVVNHMAWAGELSQISFKNFNPFNSSRYAHPPCPISNYNNQYQVENCWLGYNTAVNLVDVNTTRSDVRGTYYSWISNLVKTYSIDGLRVDTVKHVSKDFWPGFNKAAGVYNLGEVANGDFNYACDYQNYMDGLLNYPLYYPLVRAFQSTSGSISDLVNEVNALKSTCKDTTLMGTFIENHDNPRFSNTTSDQTLKRNAMAFGMLADGIPIIYQGQEQAFSGGQDPYNREALWFSGYNTGSTLYKFIKTINTLRNTAIKVDGNNYLLYKAIPIYNDNSVIAMRKGTSGSVVGVFTNQGAGGRSYTLSIRNTGYSSGTQVIDVLSCTRVTAGTSGSISVPMSKGEPRIFYPVAKLSGTKICNL